MPWKVGVGGGESRAHHHPTERSNMEGALPSEPEMAIGHLEGSKGMAGGTCGLGWAPPGMGLNRMLRHTVRSQDTGLCQSRCLKRQLRRQTRPEVGPSGLGPRPPQRRTREALLT